MLLAYFIPVMALMGYGTLGNFAAFFEIVIAVLLDGNRRRIQLLPLNGLGFFVSLFAICRAMAEAGIDSMRGRALAWDKTRRYRTPAPE
jgi:hypothetical protein